MKDSGLLVELKRLAIKQATDNGQIVEDSELTDQAIFDRLELDIKFRSLATRLVQRYGYLLPSFNPDSEIGKQRDLLLKERAKRQLQVEAQEDAEIDAEIKKQAKEAENAGKLRSCQAGLRPARLAASASPGQWVIQHAATARSGRIYRSAIAAEFGLADSSHTGWRLRPGHGTRSSQWDGF